MKRILAILLSALLIVTGLAGVMVAFAEDDAAQVEPVYLIDGEELNVFHGFNNCEGTYSYENGYITLVATGDDPYYHLMVEEPPVEVAPWIVIKYRTSCEMEGQIFASQSKPAREDCSFRLTYGSTGSWTTAVLNLPSRLSVDSVNPDTGELEIGYDPDTNLLGWLRYDFGEKAGDWIDIEYVAFFEDSEDAFAYEHTLPTPPAPPVEDLPYDQEDGATQTYILDSEDFFAKVDWYNQAEGALGDGKFATFTATDADPYFVFKDADVGVTGKQASYFVIKYRTEATSQGTPKIEAYSAIMDGPSWGPATHAEAELVPDGQWHYVLVDASDSLGNYDKKLHSFRLDMLAAAEAGETIDIAVIKLFEGLADVKGFFEARAELGDAEAQAFLDETPIVVPDPEPETTTKVEETTLPAVETEPAEGETNALETESAEADTTVAEVEESTTSAAAEDEETTVSAAVEDTHAGDESTEAPEAAGCKGVVASASILAGVALAAGVVISKKRED